MFLTSIFVLIPQSVLKPTILTDQAESLPFHVVITSMQWRIQGGGGLAEQERPPSYFRQNFRKSPNLAKI